MKKISLEDVCFRITDGAHASPKSVSEGLPMASVKDLSPYGINYESCRLISEIDFQKLVHQGCQPQKDDVLIAKDGASALDTVCLFKDSRPVVLLSSVAILRADPKIVLPAYMRYYLDSNTTRNYMKNAFTTGAAIPRVVLKDFKRVQIRLPEIENQNRIVSILSAYDDLIENNTRRIQILEEMAQRIYMEWFVHFRFPGHENAKMVDSELGRIPNEWEIRSIKDTFSILGGGTPSKKKDEYWVGGTINWYTPSDLTKSGNTFMDESISKTNELGLKKSSAKLFPAYSVMMTSRATLGVVAINTTDACTNQGFITCLPNNDFPVYFMFQWIKANVELFIGKASGTTFKEITKGVFKEIPIVVPENDIVEQFEKSVSSFMELILCLQRKNENLRQTRDLLLHKLISGDIDVSEMPDPKEAAAA